MLNFKSIKTKLIIYLICFAVFLTVRDRDFSFLLSTLVTVIAALVSEALLLFFRTKRFQVTESSIITGLIIGFVISGDVAWWKIVFAASLAILSKHLLRFQKKHIFNPAAFGILLTLLLFGIAAQWKGTYAWYILAPLGVYFVYKLKKIELILGYAAVSLLLFGTQAVLNNIPVWKIFGYFSYFYIFVMVIEPKTTPSNSLAKYLFGIGLAALIFILTGLGARFDVELFSLLAMNITVPVLNKLTFRKGGLG